MTDVLLFIIAPLTALICVALTLYWSVFNVSLRKMQKQKENFVFFCWGITYLVSNIVIIGGLHVILGKFFKESTSVQVSSTISIVVTGIIGKLLLDRMDYRERCIRLTARENAFEQEIELRSLSLDAIEEIRDNNGQRLSDLAKQKRLNDKNAIELSTLRILNYNLIPDIRGEFLERKEAGKKGKEEVEREEEKRLKRKALMKCPMCGTDNDEQVIVDLNDAWYKRVCKCGHEVKYREFI